MSEQLFDPATSIQWTNRRRAARTYVESARDRGVLAVSPAAIETQVHCTEEDAVKLMIGFQDEGLGTLKGHVRCVACDCSAPLQSEDFELLNREFEAMVGQECRHCGAVYEDLSELRLRFNFFIKDPAKNGVAVESSEQLTLKVKRLSDTAKLPTKGRESDAGIDFYADGFHTLLGMDVVYLAKTGVALEIPDGWYMQLLCRSGMAKDGWRVSGGVIDSSYRGEIIAILQHDGGPTMGKEIVQGDKICQGVLLPVPKVKLVEVDELSESDRGDKGFGSSGR